MNMEAIADSASSLLVGSQEGAKTRVQKSERRAFQAISKQLDQKEDSDQEKTILRAKLEAKNGQVFFLTKKLRKLERDIRRTKETEMQTNWYGDIMSSMFGPAADSSQPIGGVRADRHR